MPIFQTQICIFFVLPESFWDDPLHCPQESFSRFNGETLLSKLINRTQRTQCTASLSSIFGTLLDFLQVSRLSHIYITETSLLLSISPCYLRLCYFKSNLWKKQNQQTHPKVLCFTCFHCLRSRQHHYYPGCLLASDSKGLLNLHFHFYFTWSMLPGSWTYNPLPPPLKSQGGTTIPSSAKCFLNRPRACSSCIISKQNPTLEQKAHHDSWLEPSTWASVTPNTSPPIPHTHFPVWPIYKI